MIGKDLEAAYKLTDKPARQNAIDEARTKAREAFEASSTTIPRNISPASSW